jgi:ribosomal protein S18 acetylase RimI-like enzyme
MTRRNSLTASQLLIREATPADLSAVGRLHALSQRTTYRTILPPGATNDIDEERSSAAWRARLTSPGTRRLLLAQSSSDDIVGFGLITADHPPRAALNALHVRPDLHGLGVGSTLLDALLAAALEWRRTHVHLSVLAENHQARGFYLHHGWTLTGQGPDHAIAGHPVDTRSYTRSLH